LCDDRPDELDVPGLDLRPGLYLRDLGERGLRRPVLCLVLAAGADAGRNGKKNGTSKPNGGSR